jgi:FKBP-type peptidyl-prolyl cis-trans isomerase
MPKTVLDKCLEAVKVLAEPGGASRPAIAKFIKDGHGEEKAAALKRALQKGVDKKALVQNGQRFALVGVELAPRVDEKVEKTVLKVGDEGGPAAARGDEVEMSYVGRLEDGSVFFDKAGKFAFTLGAGDVIKGWDLGVAGMRVGEKARLVVPPKLGYGKRGSGKEIPPDSTLIFELTLKAIK